MRPIKSLLLAACMLLMSSGAAAAEWEDSPDVSALFDAAGASGTFVLYDVAAGRLVGHDADRARTRFVPASTFKIPNTLIGLAHGTVHDVDEVLPYGGKPQPFPAWEKDMALREAIRVSNVPVYQELARRTGLEAMRGQLALLDYGNGEIGTRIDDFWLVGPLQISAVEQARFLALLAQGRLNFPAGAQQSVREISLLEKGDGFALYGKTGWANPGAAGVGWWVGWLERGDRVYTFALNMDMQSIEDAPKRIQLGKASLKALGVM